MAGILASMAAGGAAGGFQAYGQSIDENVKAKREAEKEAVLEARMKNMMEIQQRYQTSERFANQEFQTRNETREKSQDQALVNYMSIEKGKQGGDEYSGPIDRDSYKPQMSGKGLLSVREQEIREEDRDEDRKLKKQEQKWKEEDRPLQKDLTEAQIAKALKDDKKNYHYETAPDGTVSVYEEGKLIQGQGKGKVPRDPDADPKPDSFKYKEALLKFVQNSTKDIAPEDPARPDAESKAATLFNANMQGWEKVSHPKTGQAGYKMKDGTIIDIHGNVIARPGRK